MNKCFFDFGQEADNVSIDDRGGKLVLKRGECVLVDANRRCASTYLKVLLVVLASDSILKA